MAVVRRATMNQGNNFRNLVVQYRNPILAFGLCILFFQVLSNLFFSDSGSEMDALVSKPEKAHPSGEVKTSAESMGRKEELQATQDVTNSKNIVHKEVPEAAGVPDAKAMKDYHFDQELFFSHFYKGKAGAVIEDMLMAHSYAFHRNVIYGGACGQENSKIKDYEELLESIGLKEALPFSCIGDRPEIKRSSTVARQNYRKDNTRTWTPEYVAYLKSLVNYPPKDSGAFTIAVHIRRGDVTPCLTKNEGYYRYLPNLHFLNIIEQYYKPGARVVIYSQSPSHESLDAFRSKGYEVSVGNELKEVWRALVSADVVILSRSDFSMVPAVVARGTVVYTPFWHPPIRGWVQVDQEILDATDVEISRLQESCTVRHGFK